MMKKKALCLALLSIAGLLSSCGKTVGDASSSISEVYAIYEEYKANGGALSYDEWLASIRSGESEKGDKGDKGEKGDKGSDGATILTGTSAPEDSLGKEDDVYLNTNNGDVYVKGASSWEKKGNVKTDMGVYVVSATYDEKGNLIITYSDGSKEDLGRLKKDSYTVRFHIGNDLVKTLNGVEAGSKLSVPDGEATAGYKVTSWYTIDDGLNCPWSFSGCTVTSDLDLYADYTCNQYSVSFVDEKLYTRLDAMSVEYSKSYALPSITAPEGWTFVGWKKSDGSELDSGNGYRVVGDITLYASWAATSSTLTLDANGGSVEVNSLSVTYDQSYELPTPTKEGSAFLGWYDSNGSRVSSSAIWKGLSGATYTAKWTEDANTYALDAGNGTLGEGVEDTLSLTSGASYTLPTPKNALEHSLGKVTFTSYSFLGWYLGDELVASSGTSWDYASSERTLVAKYEAKEVYYGYYPQSHVGDTTITSQLTALASSSSSYKTDRGWYYLNGTYYASARQHASNDYTLSDGTSITPQDTSTIHWFKVEPIKWRILSSEEGTYSLVSSSLLRGDVIYANSLGPIYYDQSHIRDYINGDFYKDAFSFDSSLVQTVEVDNSASTTGIEPNVCACDNTFDKVYLLSYKDCVNSAYFKNQSDRMCSPTDYALCNLANGEEGYGYYFTRSPSGNSWYVVYSVKRGGGTSPNNVLNDQQASIRPCITIKVS